MLLLKLCMVVLCTVSYSETFSVTYRLNSLEAKMRRFEKLTGKMDVSSIKAGSAGMADGNICSIQINNGRNICPQRRGYNIVAFDPYTGQTLSGHFDVFNKGNKDRMMKFLKEEVQFGMVVIISVRDEASRKANFNSDDEKFMATLGVSGGACPLKLGYRYSFAIVTAKTLTGVPPGWRRCKYAAAHNGRVDIEVKF